MSQLLTTMSRGGIKQSADVRALGRQYWGNVVTVLGECFDCFTGSLHQSRFACLTFLLHLTGFGDDVSYVYSPNGLYPGDLKFLTFLRTDTLTELLQDSLSLSDFRVTLK